MMPPASPCAPTAEQDVLRQPAEGRGQDGRQARCRTRTRCSRSLPTIRALTRIVKKFKPSVILISGCQDNQTSMDGDHNGAFTEQLLQVWNHGRLQAGITPSSTPRSSQACPRADAQPVHARACGDIPDRAAVYRLGRFVRACARAGVAGRRVRAAAVTVRFRLRAVALVSLCGRDDGRNARFSRMSCSCFSTADVFGS